MFLGHLRYQQGHTHCRLKDIQVNIYLRDLGGTLLSQECLGSCFHRINFTMLRCPGIQRSCSHGSRGSITMTSWCWFCKNAWCSSEEVMDTSTKISREGLEARQSIAELEYLWDAPERVMHEAVKVKLKLEWKPQKLRDTNNDNCLCWKTASCESIRPRQAQREHCNW